MREPSKIGRLRIKPCYGVWSPGHIDPWVYIGEHFSTVARVADEVGGRVVELTPGREISFKEVYTVKSRRRVNTDSR